MSYAVAILGESGSGKSTSIRNLNPEETFILNVINKPLPFRGGKKKYTKYHKQDNPSGNMISTDRSETIVKMLHFISTNLPHVKNIVIDDSQYIMTNEFMRRSNEKGYDKFTEIARHFWDIVNASKELRDDLFVFFLAHTQENERGAVKMKTVGRMIDDKVTPEGLFTMVFVTSVEDGKYKFITNTNGSNPAKTPMGMFDEMFIDNDLQLIIDTVNQYYEGD